MPFFIKQQISRLVQIESICRQQNKCNSKTEILFGIARKHCREKEKMHFLFFPHCFQKAFSLGSLKGR